jgi:hypothetical protein
MCCWMDAGPELGSEHLWVFVYHCRLRDAIVVKKCNINTYMWIREIANPIGWIFYFYFPPNCVDSQCACSSSRTPCGCLKVSMSSIFFVGWVVVNL